MMPKEKNKIFNRYIMPKDWIKGAINPKDEGKFSAKAKRAGMSTKAYANKVVKQLKGKTDGNAAKKKLLRQAVLAKTLIGFKK
jgi:hypothetical protein